MIMVGMPASSIALCTITAERWQVPQPAVINTASTPSSFKSCAICGPVSSVNFCWFPPPPMNPMWVSATSAIKPSSFNSLSRSMGNIQLISLFTSPLSYPHGLPLVRWMVYLLEFLKVKSPARLNLYRILNVHRLLLPMLPSCPLIPW